MDTVLTENLFAGDALDDYPLWAAEVSPTAIISDGAYGVGGFPGDPRSPEGLGEWYRPHIESWAQYSEPHTALWFWNTEVGWAEVHPVLKEYGWKYVQTCTWDKGIGHIAGNVNSKTIRTFPVVTEICVLYQREPVFNTSSGGSGMSLQECLRSEWKRSGLSFAEANRAAGVKNAASRKWLASDSLFYPPPFDMLMALKDYANTHGRALEPGEEPYFSSKDFSTERAWVKLRYKWNHVHGITNVWTEPSLRSKERLKLPGGKTVHLNQKPISLAQRIIGASTEIGDAVWEPFGGTGTFAYVAESMGRVGRVAESNPSYQSIIESRLKSLVSGKV